MKKLFLVTLIACAANGASSQDAVKYAKHITGDGLKKHLSILAHDDMEGRETGTEGQRKAAAYIESQFKSMGLKKAKGLDGYQQFYPLYQDSMVSADLKVEDIKATYGTDYIVSANANADGEFKGKGLVFVGYGIEDKNYSDYAGKDVKDKVVVFFSGEPKQDGKYVVSGTDRFSEWTFPGLRKKIALAAEKGAVGALVISNTSQEGFNQRSIDNSKKSSMYYPRPDTTKKINYAILSNAFAKSLLGVNADSLMKYAKTNRAFQAAEYFENASKVKLEYKKYRTTLKPSNVLGIIEGTDKKDEYVFLTAHYDHLGKQNGVVYNGADDDGSGTVGVIHMAEAFMKAKKDGKGPRRTIVFMTVSGEEKGLWGSEYYSDNPVYPLDKTTVDLNTDMIGRIDTERLTADSANYLYVVGHDKISTELPVINEGVNAKYTNLVLDYKFDDPNDKERIYFRSDHYNFARKGVPVLFFYDGMLKSDYHKSTDDIEKINWPLFEKRTRLIFHTAWEMANRNDMLKRDLPLPTATR